MISTHPTAWWLSYHPAYSWLPEVWSHWTHSLPDDLQRITQICHPRSRWTASSSRAPPSPPHCPPPRLWQWPCLQPHQSQENSADLLLNLLERFRVAAISHPSFLIITFISFEENKNTKLNQSNDIYLKLMLISNEHNRLIIKTNNFCNCRWRLRATMCWVAFPPNPTAARHSLAWRLPPHRTLNFGHSLLGTCTTVLC